MKRPRARRVALGLCGAGLVALIAALITMRESVLDHCYLAWNFKKLCSAARSSYDPWSGEFAVEYGRGEIDRDLRYLWGPRRALTRNQDAPGSKKASLLTISEEEPGTLLLPFPFQGSLEMEYTLKLKSGDVSTILMSSSDGKNYAGVKFGNIELFRDGRKVHLPLTEEYHPTPDSKYRRRAVAMRVRCDPFGNGPDAKVSVWIDEESGTGEENSCFVPAQAGFVGFSWDTASFGVRDLKIRGKLEKHLAAEVLRGNVWFGERTPERSH